MDKIKLQQLLVKNGWDSTSATRMSQSTHLDNTMDIDKWKDSLVGAICMGHPNSMHIVRYLSEAVGKDVPEWDDMTTANLRKVRNYLTSKVTVNSARVYLAHIKSTLNLYNDKIKVSPAQITTATKTKQTPVQNVALTEEELERIHRYVPKTQTEADIKREFMIEALCGARNSDVKGLTSGNVSGEWITYVSKKTKTKTTVPLHKNLMGYLEQKPGKEHKRKVIIQTLQRICKSVGIDQCMELFTKGKMQKRPKYEFIGSHTARRSFASQLALRGVPIAVISKFMGHSSAEMTMRYICVQTDSISPDVKAFFN